MHREGEKERGREKKDSERLHRNNKLNLRNTETQRNEARGWSKSVGESSRHEGAKKEGEQSE